MAGIVAFIYIVSTICYLALGDNGRGWGGFAYISLLLTLVAFMYLPKPSKALHKDFVDFAIGITIVRTLYTVICIYADTKWVYATTNYFTFTIIISFILFLVYSAFAHKKL